MSIEIVVFSPELSISTLKCICSVEIPLHPKIVVFTTAVDQLKRILTGCINDVFIGLQILFNHYIKLVSPYNSITFIAMAHSRSMIAKQFTSVVRTSMKSVS